MKLTPLKWYVILTVIAIGLALGLPPDPQTLQHLHTSTVAYRIAIAALLIPYALIWYASFYAFAKLQEYSRPLTGTKDGKAFHKITIGIGTLAFSLIVPTIISLILNNIAAHHHGFKTTAIITNNYLGLYPGLLAFVLLNNGTRALLHTTHSWARKFDLRLHFIWFLLLSVVFSHLAIENSYRDDPYHLSVVLLILTVIVPYLYGWVIGLLSAYNLRLYATAVPGILYKRAIKRFATGITITIIASILIQFVSITITQRLSSSLGAVLLIDYGLLIVVGVGLLLVALGAKRLKKIEEV